MTDKLPMPEVVKFKASGHPNTECIFSVITFPGTKPMYMLNLKLATINFDAKPTIDIDYLPHSCRVRLNDGNIWFDTDEVSAARIEQLIETGKAPTEQST